MNGTLLEYRVCTFLFFALNMIRSVEAGSVSRPGPLKAVLATFVWIGRLHNGSLLGRGRS
jgi:hypothetical protein